MPVIIVGGIITGVATPTEVAVLAVLYALVVGRWVYRDLSWSDVLGAITGVAREVSVILSLVAFASVYSYVLTLLRIPQNLVAALVSISGNPTIVMLAVNGVLLVVGAFITTTPALILTVPVLMPVAHQVGIDPVYFLIVVCFNLTLAMIMPPVGIVLFIASKIGGVPRRTSIRGTRSLLSRHVDSVARAHVRSGAVDLVTKVAGIEARAPVCAALRRRDYA